MFQKRVLPVMVALAASGAMNTHAQQDLLEEIVVQGVRSAELNAREMERQKNIFSSVISQDDSGNFADQNVAEALQRLPGVTLTKSDGQGEYVNVRGMGAGFVGVSLNNSEMASASSDGRAVGLNTIPADLMGSIEVFKSLTPDMDLNSIAGRVNVNSVTAFNRGQDSLRLSVQGMMHDQRGEFSPKATIIGTKLLADERVGLALSLSHEKRATEVNQIANDGGLQFIRPARPGIGTNYDGNEYDARSYADNYFYNLQEEDALGADPWMDVPRMLTPNSFQVRQDESVRTLTAATFDFGWRPTTESEYYFRISRTEYTDEELTLRETYNFGASDPSYVAYVNTDFEPTQSWIDTYGFSQNNLFAMGYADLEQQVFIEKSEDTNTTATIGGEHNFGEDWRVDFEFHTSNSVRENPDDRRVRFRSRRLAMAGQLGKEDIYAAVIPSGGLSFLADQAGTPRPAGAGIPGTGGMSGTNPAYIGGQRYQPNMTYDNLYLSSGTREDDLNQFSFNLQKDFTEGPVNYVKAGFLMKERERSRDRVTVSINPGDHGSSYCVGEGVSEQDALLCRVWNKARLSGATPEPFYEQQLRDQYGDDWDSSILEFTSYTPRNPRIDHDFITIADAERLIARTRLVPANLGLDQLGAATRADDYFTFEDSQEAYLMAEFQAADDVAVTAGARYVKTDIGSTGYFTLRHDRFLGQDGFPRDIIEPLTDPAGGQYVTNSYDGVYPGVHLRWDMTDQILVRGAIWQSYTRPSFGQSAPRAQFAGQVVLCRDEPLNAGDPNNERERCSNSISGELGIPEDVGDPNNDNAYYYRIAQELSLAPGGNSLTLGNTDLKAMEATNFDASISFYGDRRFLEAALFYKDLTNYVVDVRGLSVARQDLPENVRTMIDRIDSTGVTIEELRQQHQTNPMDFSRNVFMIDENFVFHNVNTTINGDSAQVFGLELSYSEYFDSGLFLNTNLTLLNSRADAGETVRASRTRMPNQADITGNVTVGWENDFMSARLIGYYRSKIMTQMGTCSQADINRDVEWARINDMNYDGADALEGRTGDGTVHPNYCQRWADVFHDDVFSLDFKATYNLTSNIRFYLDVINITEDTDVFYYRGTPESTGNVLQFSESIGRTYQAGVNVRFW